MDTDEQEGSFIICYKTPKKSLLCLGSPQVGGFRSLNLCVFRPGIYKRQSQIDLCEFTASLNYTMNSMSSKTTK